MSLLAQLFRHKDAAPADGGEPISLGAVAAAVEWKADEQHRAPSAATAQPADAPPAAPKSESKISATPEEIAPHKVVSGESRDAPVVPPQPDPLEVLAFLESSVASEAFVAAAPPAPASVAAAAPGDFSPGTGGQSDPAPPPAVTSAGAADSGKSPITSHESHEPQGRTAIATETAGAAPVILAPRVMELAPGAPPPVFLVPVGFTPPVLPTWTDGAARAAAKDEAHANH
jgi:hypothetical protein